MMKFISKLSKETEVDKIIDDLTKDCIGKFDLGFLFLSPNDQNKIGEIVAAINNRINVRYLLGCTCAGVIGEHNELERQPASTLILAQLPGVRITPFMIDQSKLNELNSPKDWYEYFDIYPNEKPKILTLPDPFSFDINKFLKGVNAAYPNCPVIGGLASGAHQPHDNTLILNDELFEDGLIGVVLRGDVDIQTIVSQGCRPIGETYIITKAEENIVYELAGRPLLDVLKDVMDKASVRDKLLLREAIFVGIAMDEYKHKFRRGDFLIRALIGIDQKTGAGAIADYIKVGQTVQFHVRDAETATEDLNELLNLQQKKDDVKRPKGALVFSCNGRGEHLFKEKNHDIDIIQRYVGPIPAAGFFCAGELGPVGKSNFLHGFTSSIALFYNDEESGISDDKNNKKLT